MRALLSRPVGFQVQQLIIGPNNAVQTRLFNAQFCHELITLFVIQLGDIGLNRRTYGNDNRTFETPSRLQWIAWQKIDSYMRKPVRFDGVMTAFTLALNHAARINLLEAQLRRQEERLRARKFLFSAQLRVMYALRLEEDNAYSLLRRASMAQHMTIENLSCELLNDTESWLNRLGSLLAE